MGASSSGNLGHHRRRSLGQGQRSAPPSSSASPPLTQEADPSSNNSPASFPTTYPEEQKDQKLQDDSASVDSHSDDSFLSEDLDEMDFLSSDDDLHDDEETGLTVKQRRQRRRRRHQRQQLDARIAGGKAARHIMGGLGMADRTVIKRLLVNAILISLWYFFSLAISIVSQKKKDRKLKKMKYPILI